MHLVLIPFRRIFDYSGRSSRKEFWAYFLPFLVVVPIALSVIIPASVGYDTSRDLGPIMPLVGLYFLIVLVPAVSLFVRRLHDSNFSGWWALLLLIPYAGVALMVAMAAIFGGTPGPNRFGERPEEAVPAGR